VRAKRATILSCGWTSPVNRERLDISKYLFLARDAWRIGFEEDFIQGDRKPGPVKWAIRNCSYVMGKNLLL
jgi:hypothetical protein